MAPTSPPRTPERAPGARSAPPLSIGLVGATDAETDSTASPLSDAGVMALATLTPRVVALPRDAPKHAAASAAAAVTSALYALDDEDDTLKNPDERRRRRNEKERLRVRGVKDRMQKLRDELTALQLQHDRLQHELERRVVVRNDASAAEKVAGTPSSVVAATEPQETDDSVSEAVAQQLRRYLGLVKETEVLQSVKQSLETQLRPRVLQTTALRTLVTVDGDPTLTPVCIVDERPVRDQNTSHVKAIGHDSDVDDTYDSQDAVADANRPSQRARCTRVGMNPVSLFENVLFAHPLDESEAYEHVRQTCEEMMRALTRPEWEDGGEAFGWRGARILDKSVLHFRLTQRFLDVSARELMQRTWGLLTTLDEYQRIQPETSQLKVLQRINDECWIIGITVGSHLLRHSVLLVARALIHGGYLVTFRSIPLSAARQQFLKQETGGIYANVFSWYNFQERANDAGGVDCEVIFGGSASNGHQEYLQQLRLELLSGITRWQSAVGFSLFQFAQTLSPG